MKTDPLFEPSQEEIDALVSRYPLALVISADAAGLAATPLPLLLERNAHGIATLVGYFARQEAPHHPMPPDFWCDSHRRFHDH